ncbi:hypothetical protein EC2770900_1693 [Escherichia coli 2770900]|nr:hypothetical protein EC2770900_1693 [Escherichia coli 2770900]
MLHAFVDAVPALEELTEPTRGLPAECWRRLSLQHQSHGLPPHGLMCGIAG